MTLSDAAARIQRSAATLSRLENGKSIPRLVDVEALLDHYAERSKTVLRNGEREHIIELAEAGRAQEWFAPFRDVLSSDMTADDHQRYVGFETDATGIRSFQPELVPGLLQTRAYAAAVTEMFFPTHGADERDRFVDFRIARQHILTRPSGAVDFDVVIGEAALRRVVGSAEIMREQLSALLDNIRNGLPNVRIRIAPIGLSIPPVVGGPFLLMDFPSGEDPGLVYLEARRSAQYVQTPAEFERYVHLFQELSDAVLGGAQSRSIVEGALKELS